jgi:hypothetical protein
VKKRGAILKHAVIAAVCLWASAAQAQVFETPFPGVWSRGASYLWPGPTAIADMPLDGREISVTSPDSSFTVKVDDSEFIVFGPGGPMLSGEIYSLAELLWARDSKVFAVTSSEGGWVGTWSVRLYWTADGNVTDPGKFALQSFKREFPRCPEEHPNVGVVGWLQASRRLQLLVEMPCHSSCAQMCQVRGYVVDSASGRILERLSDNAVRKRWKRRLGGRFQR